MERSYHDFVVEPRPQPGFSINTLVTTVGVSTVMEFVFTPSDPLTAANSNAVAGD